MLSTRLLLVHRAVVREGSLTAAAHDLGYTVSAVSQQLERLEQQAGMALFEKAGRGVRPTEAGLLLADHAERILHEVGEAQDALANLREGRAGRLRVVTFFSAGESLLPEAIAAMRRELPGLHVRPTVDEEAGALRRLRAGEVELVVVVEPFARGRQPDDDLHRWHLLDDEYRLLLPAEHPLARRGTVGIDELADEDWVVTAGPIDYVRQTTGAICRRAGFTPRLAAESDEFPVTQGYVAAGIGVALAPLLALRAVRPGVAVRRLQPPPEPRHIWATTRVPLRDHPPVLRMVEALRAAARGLGREAAEQRA
ncbi:MAG: LysR family transcriptional regulator [Candidatus Nanopelagicales bacterium]|jgi:DNA-binding transcriptional LysR family regulator|nr:LysR family transcriptional regulator [Candidatus Nanopelagicales bacterium]